MSHNSYEVLDHISEGVVLIDDTFHIIYWNDSMEDITGKGRTDILQLQLFQVLPRLDLGIYRDALAEVMQNGMVRFFSAAMHRELVVGSNHYNLKITRIEKEEGFLLQLEFLNVTSQINQINQLKYFVRQLGGANRELREKEKIIRKLAYYDKLTGIANRSLFYELAGKFVSTVRKRRLGAGLMFCDINKFKKINDTYGHEVGDKVLKHVAEVLLHAVYQKNIVARYGGDEFLVFMPDMKNRESYHAIASRIMRQMENALVINGEKIPLSLSMGISFYPQNASTLDHMISMADKAMYEAKQISEGNNCFCLT